MSTSAEEQIEPVKRSYGTAAQVLALLGFLTVPFLTDYLGSVVTTPYIRGWYASSIRPSWTPANEVFVGVWYFMYVLIGISGWLMWRYVPDTPRGTEIRFHSLWFFSPQLALNALWSPLFFSLYPLIGTTALWIAFIVMMILCLLLLSYMWEVRKVSGIAAYLMIPYLLWGVFASTINLYMALHK